MINNWQQFKVGDIATIYDGPHATPKKVNYGPIFLGISNLNNGRLDLNDLEHLSEDDFVRWTKRVTPKEDDIVFSYETRLGQAAIIPRNLRCCLGRRMGLLRVKKHIANPKFLLYYYISPVFREVIESRKNHGSTVDRIPLVELPDYPVYLPMLKIQDKIASLLSSLDDKIQLNRRMNQTLEQIAATLFKKYFVDDIDPDNLPEGWRIGKVNDLGKIICGKTPSKTNQDFFGGPVPFIKIPDMHGETFIVSTQDSLTVEGANSQSNKFVSEGSICVSCIATVGLVSITTNPSQTNQQINTIVPKANDYRYYTYFALKSLKDHLKDLGSGGTATLNVNTGLFSNIEVVIPSENQLSEFQTMVEPTMQMIKNNQHQNEILSSIRDTLLPKLMSGQIILSAVHQNEQLHAEVPS